MRVNAAPKRSAQTSAGTVEKKGPVRTDPSFYDFDDLFNIFRGELQ